MPELRPLRSVSPADVERLLDDAFGPDRFGRTAYKLREGVNWIDALSFAAFDAGKLVGAIQCWPIALEAPDGSLESMTLVGPVAVLPDRQRGGTGKAMMHHMLAIADRDGFDALMMIGDPEYYDRFFGFNASATAQWELPGPFERHRLLARIRRPGGLAAAGRIIPDPAFARADVSA